MTNNDIIISDFTTVVGMLYKNINLIIITVILMPITCLLTFYTLLTLDDCGNNRTEIKQKRRKRIRDYDDIEDDYDYSCKPVKKGTGLTVITSLICILKNSSVAFAAVFAAPFG